VLKSIASNVTTWRPEVVSKKTITVKSTTFEKLAKLKEALGYTTWDEVLNDFIKCVERAVKSASSQCS
jgi:predicted CopG family antitoxin